jgi:hypothetical protein
MGSYQEVFIPCQDHDVIWACSLGIAAPGGGEMDALLECVVPRVCGFLLLRPIVVGAQDWRYLTPARGNAYPHQGALGHAEALVPFSGTWVR